MSDDLTLHPRVRQAIYEGNRDRPLTLNWKPIEPDAFDFLDLPKLNPIAEKAKRQIMAEALAAGGKFISYSRRYEFYSYGQRYYRDTYSRAAILPAVGQLAAAGILEHEKMPPGHRGMQSRFRAHQSLLVETAKVPIVYTPLEIIVLRDGNGIAIDYRDNRHTRAMRHRLQELNEGLAAQEIGLNGRIIREGDRLDNGGRAQIQMHRVFNRADFELGGRFYGSYWQNLEDRTGFTINGEPTVETDYTGIHIAMLYQEAGKSMPADPYDIDGWPRKQTKIALLVAINAPSHRKAVQALADWLRVEGNISDPFKAAQALLRAVKAKHPDIAHAFGSDAGIRLMRRDSELADRIMHELVRITGIVPLCIHDGFIVQARHEES